MRRRNFSRQPTYGQRLKRLHPKDDDTADSLSGYISMVNYKIPERSRRSCSLYFQLLIKSRCLPARPPVRPTSLSNVAGVCTEQRCCKASPYVLRGAAVQTDLLLSRHFAKPRKTRERRCNKSTISWARGDLHGRSFPALGTDFTWPGRITHTADSRSIGRHYRGGHSDRFEHSNFRRSWSEPGRYLSQGGYYQTWGAFRH